MYWISLSLILKANPDKFQFMVLRASKNRSFSISVRGITIPSKNEVILLVITTDHELKFNKHIELLCKRAYFKLHAFRRIRKYLGIEKARILANAFIESQFSQVSLDMDVCFKNGNNKICKLHTL